MQEEDKSFYFCDVFTPFVPKVRYDQCIRISSQGLYYYPFGPDYMQAQPSAIGFHTQVTFWSSVKFKK